MEDEVPVDLVEDIFCRLPVKSVVRFKGISKRWLLQIKDPKFIKLHLQRSTKSHTQGSLVTVVNKNQLCSVDLGTLRITKESDIPFSESPKCIRLVGACNGLLCLCSWDDNNNMMVWNMSTKEHRILPPVPEEYASEAHRLSLVGFGYDPCNDDYKVFRFYNYSMKGHLAIFYSLRLNSWGSNYKQEYHNFRQFAFVKWAGVYAGGALNWIAHTTHHTIIGLDLNTENVRDLRFPYKPNEPFFRINSILVLEGKLCVAGRKDHAIDIWVMEEYGKEESWKFLYSIPPCSTSVGGINYVFKPLTYYHCGKDGDQVLPLMLAYGGKLSATILRRENSVITVVSFI
ncbi:hypothetical protein COLO4_09396 [Corchorus olitorius]|uniref:F-box domain-containing protein n=1 Tax=Corchorus olitorius TaxID=93759 RepID=A0A1R3KC83_9ROSI|nr:hypothetical protein COLO4_09396 [Corchorus olitorius]